MARKDVRSVSTNDCQELRECPFCGGKAYLTASSDGYGVECRNELCVKTIMQEHSTESEAIAAWNTRADYHGYEQSAIEAWENIKAWNTRAERTCRNIDDAEAQGYFKCSACGAECSVEWCHSGWGVPSFCPHCGAKVVEE